MLLNIVYISTHQGEHCLPIIIINARILPYRTSERSVYLILSYCYRYVVNGSIHLCKGYYESCITEYSTYMIHYSERLKDS